MKRCNEMWRRIAEEEKPRYLAMAVVDQGRYAEEVLAYAPDIVPTEEDLAELVFKKKKTHILLLHLLSPSSNTSYSNFSLCFFFSFH